MSKKVFLMFLIFPLLFCLSGCSHVSKLKHGVSSATYELRGKSTRNYVYLKDGKKVYKTKVSDNIFSFDVPRSLYSRSVYVSVNNNLKSAKKVTIPASSSLSEWSDFYEDFNDAELISSTGQNDGPKLPSKFENITNGRYNASIRKQNLTFWLCNGKLVAVRVKGNYPIKKFSYMCGIVASAANINYLQAKDKVNQLKLSPGDPVKTIKGTFNDGVHYRASNVEGTLQFDLWK